MDAIVHSLEIRSCETSSSFADIEICAKVSFGDWEIFSIDKDGIKKAIKTACDEFIKHG